MTERHLRRHDVEQMTGLSRSSIYAMMQDGRFPRPVRVGTRAVAWPESVLRAWLAGRPPAAPGNS
ncbi:helix-turn-helix transcriptional regulator [Limimaricola cinnabarinus]|uniref:helix-turn-helix transcriptional regulator n=1 Tax=Limimaricola cinnabarinus TaxID=1125964 RepID=UPI00249165AD|nr:AlpA family transcriptional regulator [Limimaricola cinnabarinus]